MNLGKTLLIVLLLHVTAVSLIFSFQLRRRLDAMRSPRAPAELRPHPPMDATREMIPEVRRPLRDREDTDRDTDELDRNDPWGNNAPAWHPRLLPPYVPRLHRDRTHPHGLEKIGRGNGSCCAACSKAPIAHGPSRGRVA